MVYRHLQAVVADAQRVGVGEGQAELAADLAMVLDDAVQLAADVLRGHLHARQDAIDGLTEGGVEHGRIFLAEGCGLADRIRKKPELHVSVPRTNPYYSGNRDRILGVVPLFLHPAHSQVAPGFIFFFRSYDADFHLDNGAIGQIEGENQFNLAIPVYARDAHGCLAFRLKRIVLGYRGSARYLDYDGASVDRQGDLQAVLGVAVTGPPQHSMRISFGEQLPQW